MNADADLCVVSVHKMGASLEQVSVFDLQGERIDPAHLSARVDMLTITSPTTRPWTAAARWSNKVTVDRGEFPPADIDTLAQVIPMMCISRAVQQEPITREFCLALLDAVIIPGLRAGH
jgi:hypothetical protein